VAKAWH